MLVQSATSSNFQPRAPHGSKRQRAKHSPPLLPRVGARGGPVCRGQVRGSCPPGATLPTRTQTLSVYARTEGVAPIRLDGGSRARSAILWRSLDEQSVVPGRSRGTQAFCNPVSCLRFSSSCHAVLSESLTLSHENSLSLSHSLFFSSSKLYIYIYIYIYIFVQVCVERNQKLASLSLSLFLSLSLSLCIDPST